MSFIISIHPEFARKIKEGSKSVEVRRRGVNIPSGSKLWVYETIPSGKIESYAVVDYVYKGSPDEIWEKYSSNIGIDSARFFEYFSGCEYGSAIVFNRVQSFGKSVPLNVIRSYGLKSMPQTYRKLPINGELYNHLNNISEKN